MGAHVKATGCFEGESDYNNGDRARAALYALECFAEEMGMKEDAETILSDFLCDLHHLLRLSGIDWQDAIRRAEATAAEEQEVDSDGPNLRQFKLNKHGCWKR